MERIGIVTHYYDSTNYGGVLQSYALCNYLAKCRVHCEQVCYNSKSTKKPIFRKVLSLIKRVLIAFVDAFHLSAHKCISQRKKAFKSFRKSIPHSSIVYTESSIKNANKYYTAFITGSDQVWHPSVFRQCYSLLFSSRPKFSYAASMAVDEIDSVTAKAYEQALTDYKMISVRERNAQRLLSFNNSVQLVLDPVFLLTKDEWNRIASSRLIKEKYCFTYFLGDSISARREAQKCAHSKGLKIVNIPYLSNSYRKCDWKYGDYAISNVGPSDFLSLILNAECVFTDSFHAICLSFIFNKDFYVFKRESKSNMNSRITDILFTLGLEERYVSTINKFTSINYSKPTPVFDAIYKDTINYLDRMVSLLKEECDE